MVNKQKTVKRIAGIDIPTDLQLNVKRAMEYAGGAILNRGISSLESLPLRLPIAQHRFPMPPAVAKQIDSLFEEISSTLEFTCQDGTHLKILNLGYQQTENPRIIDFLRGSYSTSIVKNRQYRSFLKREVPEHEKDLTELHTQMLRNPEYIPHFAWPSREDKSPYNFSKRRLCPE